MKKSFTVEIDKCADCPHCKQKRNPGTDGFDGYRVWICQKGAFGKPCFEYNPNDYWEGRRIAPDYIHVSCPLLPKGK